MMPRVIDSKENAPQIITDVQKILGLIKDKRTLFYTGA